MLETKPNKKQKQNWQEIDLIDLQTYPGMFASIESRDYEIRGITVNAFNWLHAEHKWLKEQLQIAGGAWARCEHCGHTIRYAVTFKDDLNFYHIVGMDCADFISSKLNKKDWEIKKALSDIKEVDTKNGKRFTLRLDVPVWYWDLDKDKRPKFISLSKFKNHKNKSVWSLTIWGNNENEVLINYEIYKALK